METRSKSKAKVNSTTSKGERSQTYRPEDGIEKQRLLSERSSRKTNNTTSTLRRKKLEAQVKADEEMAKLLQEEEELFIRKMEHKKMMIQNKLALEKAKLDDVSEESEECGCSEEQDSHSKVHQWLKGVGNSVKSDCKEEARMENGQSTRESRNVKKDVSVTNEQILQLMARQSVDKELPISTGEVKEWPNFLQQFESTTNLLGLSDDENRCRLRKCLKGDAKRLVEGLLLSRAPVSTILNILKSRFGRPDLIVRSLVNEAKNLPPVKVNEFKTLTFYSEVVNNLVETLRSLDMNNYLNCPQLLDELLQKLPHNMQLQWGEKIARTSNHVFSLSDFKEWIWQKAEAASYAQVFSNKCSNAQTSKMKSTFVTSTNIIEKPIQQKKCVYCKGEHSLETCEQFISISVDEKWEFAKKNGICFGCLRKSHRIQNCSRRKKCKVNECDKLHHKLLHADNFKKEEVETVSQVVAHTSNDVSNEVLLRVAPITIKSNNIVMKIYALFDEASTVTLIDEALANELQLNGEYTNLGLRWTDRNSCKNVLSRRTCFEISGEDGKFYEIDNVYTLKDMDLPVQTVNATKLKAKWSHLRKVSFSNMHQVQPKLLLGQDNWDLICTREIIEGPKNAPALSRTKLGWVIHGNVQQFKGRLDETIVLHIKHEQSDINLHEEVKQYFSGEAFGVKLMDKPKCSKDDERAMRIMEETTKKVDGRWEIGLLWKENVTNLPDSKPLAIQRLKHIENKMQRDSEFKEAYNRKIQDYVDKGYARKIEENFETSEKVWYLPHFAVTNENKPNKIRFVFDAAAKIEGKCFNDFLIKGPDLYNSLLSIIWKFREKSIAFSADIREMFHMIKIRPEDQPAQRFLFRENGHKDTSIYQMQVMIFGAVSSPFCAQYVKNKNAMQFKDIYPDAVEGIVGKHYMDDYLDCTDTEEEAMKRVSEVNFIHKSGGFDLRGWVSNSEKLLKTIPKEIVSEEKILEDSDPTHRILGLTWNPTGDILKYPLSFHKVDRKILSGDKIPTKREMLKVIMSLFDPLGLLGCYIIKGKILLQDIWRSGMDWDDQLAEPYLKRWMRWINDLSQIGKVEIPRCYNLMHFLNFTVQLHVFCDASEQAVATVGYFRIEKDDKVHVSLIMSRTQVAPLKPWTIPRLELQAALLGTRLASKIQEEHTFSIEKRVFWTDSTTVLGWLKAEARNLRSFVAHRVGEIQENSDLSEWKWISSEMNVADQATRDSKDSNLHSNSSWFKGPDFLYLEEKYWVKKCTNFYLNKDDREIIHDILLISKNKPTFLPDIDRYSKWKKLIRVTAFTLRFIDNCRKKDDRNKQELTTDEMERAEKIWCEEVQREMFGEEMRSLKKGCYVSKGSELYQLSPYLENNLICLKGRTDDSTELLFETKRPIILPNKHRFTLLLVEYYHWKLGHGGLQMVLNEVRQKFWIIRGRKLVTNVIKSCRFCLRLKTKPRTVEMGQLPHVRLTKPERAFTFVGVDYFGPMEVTIGRKRHKRYGVLFTCLSVRAIHIELAESLTTDSAILALRRFIARRGQPKIIWSDNGSNLKAINKELKNSIQSLDNERIRGEMIAAEIEWKRISPGSPHMGGAWERMVRSVKQALHITLKEAAPRQEVLLTYLMEAEHTVNSRPLTYVSSDSNDPESLTPNHFLIGTSSIAKPPDFFDRNKGDLKKQWRISQKFAENFWNRWVREYLPTLTKRTKWYEDFKNIKEGEIVILMDNQLPRNNWPMGRIIKTYPGKDGKVRVVDIKTRTGTYRRPTVKICPLDLLELSNG